MPDMEKVIKGLECCANDKPFYHAHCDECPYNGRKPDNMGGCTKLYCDAIELLKEQEPHVMTVGEVKSFSLFADKNKPPYLYCENKRDDNKWLSCIQITCRLMSTEVFGKYGVDWRCWNLRPIDEQMNEVKWDENQN